MSGKLLSDTDACKVNSQAKKQEGGLGPAKFSLSSLTEKVDSVAAAVVLHSVYAVFVNIVERRQPSHYGTIDQGTGIRSDIVIVHSYLLKNK